MKIQNLLVSGTSLTQDGLGGCPPTDHTLGGCSYIDQGQEVQVAIPKTWAGLVAKNLNVQSFVNMAAGSHGNFLIAKSLWSMLSRFHYDPSNSLILFNISIAPRLDIPCEFDHPDVSSYVHWGPDFCSHSYLSRTSRSFEKIAKEVGLDIVENLGYAQLDFLFNYLENRHYQYFFLLAEEKDLEHETFLRMIELRRHRLITLDPGPGLLEFASILGHNTQDGHHPDSMGHEIISQQVTKYICEQLSIHL